MCNHCSDIRRYADALDGDICTDFDEKENIYHGICISDGMRYRVIRITNCPYCGRDLEREG